MFFLRMSSQIARQFVPFRFELAVEAAAPLVVMLTLFDRVVTYTRSEDWNCAPATESRVMAISFISDCTTLLSTSSSDKATSWLVKAMAFAYSLMVSVPWLIVKFVSGIVAVSARPVVEAADVTGWSLSK